MPRNTWQLQEAKAHFSEVVNRALAEGPQIVTRRGREAVVIVDAATFRRARGPRRPIDFFRQGPFLDDLVLERDKTAPRRVDL
jgi:prevent-host-death family protein